MVLLLAFGAFAVLGLASPPVPADASAARVKARAVLKAARCDSCHDSSVSAENRAALAVYDLVESDWPARMKEAQLPRLLTRLKSAPAADQDVIRRFVTLELKARAVGRR
jgi:hypothetical protein